MFASFDLSSDHVLIKTEVRTAYLESARSEQNIDETRTQMASAQEELRFAKKRYEFGLGTNLDILTAQRDL
ncbi:TolC family protein, partial [Acinetobacter baumannii]